MSTVSIPKIDDVICYSPRLPSGGVAWFWWRPDLEWNHFEILLRCPHGHFATLSMSKHQIAADGTITPSIYFKGICGEDEWHVWGRLEGWGAGDVARLALAR